MQHYNVYSLYIVYIRVTIESLMIKIRHSRRVYKTIAANVRIQLQIYNLIKYPNHQFRALSCMSSGFDLFY